MGANSVSDIGLNALPSFDSHNNPIDRYYYHPHFQMQTKK